MYTLAGVLLRLCPILLHSVAAKGLVAHLGVGRRAMAHFVAARDLFHKQRKGGG